MTEASSSSSNEQNQTTVHSPFKVLGIALVVDEIGKGARLVMRYPVTSPSHNDDLFFTLPARVMVKLFRPKKPLCGQPMTISVGGTVFCCRAVLFEEEGSALALFNILVALAPSTPTSAIPIGGWFEGETTGPPQEQKATTTSLTWDVTSASRASESFLAVRRVHVSIARLCRVLAREERRCHYVSVQSAQLIRIQAHVRHLEEKQIGGGMNDASSSSSKPQPRNRQQHRRGVSANSLATITTEVFDLDQPDDQEPPMDQYEKEQEIMELLLAASPPPQHHGNLARELVQVFHALSRNDSDFPPTPSVLLSGSHGIVYVNRHVAVPIEALSGDFGTGIQDNHRPRPYHTLLFPHATSNELIETMSMDSAPQRLQQFLLMANPRKTLSEIAVDSALPIHIVLDMAAYLVRHDACVASPVLSRLTRLACCPNVIPKLQMHALGFAQNFPPHSIFVVVGVLTKGITFGDVVSMVTSGDSDDDGAKLVGDMIAASLQNHEPTTEGTTATTPAEQLPVVSITNPRAIQVEEVLYSMAVWLRAHEVVLEMEEYLVTTAAAAANDRSPSGDPKTPSNVVKPTSSTTASTDPGELTAKDLLALYHELLDADCLNGNISTAALCWRYGAGKIQLLRSWGVLNNKLRILSRIPSPGDDWNDVP